MSEPLILLADDDPAALAAYRRPLRRQFRLVTAGSGREAIEMMQSEMPDALVSDLPMPDINGITLLTEGASRSISRRRCSGCSMRPQKGHVAVIRGSSGYGSIDLIYS